MTASEPRAETGSDAPPAASKPDTDTSAEEVPDASRPPWVGAEPRLVHGVYQKCIVVGPYSTRKECDEHELEELQKAIAEYAEEYLKGPGVAGVVEWPLPTIGEQDRWEETRRYSVGPMKNLHVLLKFDRKFNGKIEDAWREAEIKKRIGGVTGMAVLVLGSLAALFGLLKVTGRKKS